MAELFLYVGEIHYNYLDKNNKNDKYEFKIYTQYNLNLDNITQNLLDQLNYEVLQKSLCKEEKIVKIIKYKMNSFFCSFTQGEPCSSPGSMEVIISEDAITFMKRFKKI